MAVHRAVLMAAVVLCCTYAVQGQGHRNGNAAKGSAVSAGKNYSSAHYTYYRLEIKVVPQTYEETSTLPGSTALVIGAGTAITFIGGKQVGEKQFTAQTTRPTKPGQRQIWLEHKVFEFGENFEDTIWLSVTKVTPGPFIDGTITGGTGRFLGATGLYTAPTNAPSNRTETVIRILHVWVPKQVQLKK